MDTGWGRIPRLPGPALGLSGIPEMPIGSCGLAFTQRGRPLIHLTSSNEFLKRPLSPFSAFRPIEAVSFFAYKVQEYLMEVGIKFRPIKPRSPHLNGKVERAQKIVLDEFFSTVALTSDDLADQLQRWHNYYNWHRGHGARNGKTPMDRYVEKIHKTPIMGRCRENVRLSKRKAPRAKLSG
jgi:hypothetical protein